MRKLQGKVCFGLLALTLLLCSLASAKENPEEKGRPLLQASAERSLFHADSRFPFQLMLNFKVRGANSGTMNGQYAWLVSPEGDWRKETRFSDYSDLQVKRGSSLWVKRNIDFVPLQAAWVDDAFDNFVYLNRAEDTIDRYFTTSEHHVDLRCIERTRDKMARKLCFDAEGNLRMAEMKDSKGTYEYSDYRPVGQKFAPYKIVAQRDGQVVFEGDIESLSIDSKVDQRLLEPPTSAINRGGCLTPRLPKIKEKIAPRYPEDARNEHRQGSVTVYVLIASDGTVHDPVVVHTAGQSLDSAAVTAIRRWQYEPAMCTATPVDFETEVTVNFILR
jgi:TonB family protein